MISFIYESSIIGDMSIAHFHYVSFEPTADRHGQRRQQQQQ